MTVQIYSSKSFESLLFSNSFHDKLMELTSDELIEILRNMREKRCLSFSEMHQHIDSLKNIISRSDFNALYHAIVFLENDVAIKESEQQMRIETVKAEALDKYVRQANNKVAQLSCTITQLNQTVNAFDRAIEGQKQEIQVLKSSLWYKIYVFITSFFKS